MHGKKGKDVATKIVGDSLYINGEKQKDVIQTPTASDLSNLKA